MPKKNLEVTIAIVFVAVVLIIVGAGIFFRNHSQNSSKVPQMAVDFANKNLVRPGTKIKLVKTDDISGVYRLKLQNSKGGSPFYAYVTKDGRFFFIQAIDIKKVEELNAKRVKTVTVSKCEDLKKEDKPLVKVFVASFCPYGLQVEKAITELIKEIPEASKYWKVEYIGSVQNGKIVSMHGDEEGKEDLREICLREEQSGKFWPYLACRVEGSKIEDCLKKASVDEAKLNSCMADSSRGLHYAQADFADDEKYGIEGSPTLLLGNQLINESGFGGRSPQGMKNIICCAFSKKPQFCSKKVESGQVSSPKGSGSCGK